MAGESEIVHNGTIEITYSIIKYPGDPDQYDVLSEYFESDEWFSSKEEAIAWIERRAG